MDGWRGTSSPGEAGSRRAIPSDLRQGPLAPFLAEETWFEVDGAGDAVMPPDGSQSVMLAIHRLQEISDYRGALRSWFGGLRTGGRLIVVVPHAFLHDRRLALPSPWEPAPRRLYSPASLLAEVEEALTPNTYRLRWLADVDTDYDYSLPAAAPPVGMADIILVIERITPPIWSVAEPVAEIDAPPGYAFESERTRVEFVAFRPRRKILMLKLDHLGDFIMGVPALTRARSAFADCHLTLVVGSWNFDAARRLNVADEILAFDVFPRNSSEEEVDVAGKTALFQTLVTGAYDLAIDLRSDPDTRFLLRSVQATVRAGLGTKAQFPFLDIFLPIDFTRNEPETACVEVIDHHRYSAQKQTTRGDFRLISKKETISRDSAIIWGPYITLRAGNYIYEPRLELDPVADGLLSIDVALDRKWVTYTTLPAPGPVRLRFHVETPEALFESRIWAIDDAEPIGFSFYGGRLIREGASSVLHQSEYIALLIELIVMRMDRSGMLVEETP